MGYKACLFDLDGTLYPNQGFGKRLALGNMRMYENLRILAKVRSRYVGRVFADGSEYKSCLFAALSREANLLHPDSPPVNEVSMARWYHHDYYPAVITVLERHYLAPIILQDLIRRIRRKTLLGVISDTGVIEQRLEAIGLSYQDFSLRSSADQTGMLQGSTKLLKRAARDLGCSVKQLLFISDNPDQDSPLAEELGMEYFPILTSSQKSFEESYRRLSGLLS